MGFPPCTPLIRRSGRLAQLKSRLTIYLRKIVLAILLEVRDITWQEAELRAQWIGCAKEAPTVDLEI